MRVILLWKRPGAAVNEKNLTGALAHGHEVEILDQTQHDKRMFYLVTATVEGKEQKGWVAGTLLEETGKQEFERFERAYPAART